MKSSEMSRPAHLAGSVRQALQRALRRSASGAAIGLALLASAASAGTNGLTVNVVPLAPNIGTPAAPVYTVSYSGVKAALGQTLNSAYLVSIRNETTSNVNNAWFKVRSAYNGGAGLAFLDDSIPAACVKDPQVLPLGSSLICQFNDPAELVSGISFTLVVNNPNPPSSGSDSKLQLLWTVQAGQGNANANPSNVVQQATPFIVLSVNSPAGLRSYVLKNQGFKVANSGSETKVTPPVGVPVDLNEEIDGNSCSPMFKKCLKSTLTILDITGQTFQFAPNLLVIDLLRAKATLKGNADLNLAYKLLRYTGEDGTYDIQDCVADSSLTFPWKISAGSRCVVPPSGGSAGGTFVDAAGNFHFRVLATTNGIIAW